MCLNRSPAHKAEVFPPALAEYTRRPQMEFLVKLGFHQVVSDLVIWGKPHKDILFSTPMGQKAESASYALF